MASPFQNLVARLFTRDPIVEPYSGDDDGAPNFSPMAAYYRSRMELSSTRIKSYKDYNDMATDSLIAGALDIYADEACQLSPIHKKTVWVSAPKAEVANEITRMFDRVELEDHLFGMARYLCQYGDNFLRPLANKEKGIVAIEFMEAEDVERLVDRYSRLTGFRVAPFGDTPFNPWDMVHFRVMGRTQTVRQGGSVYGTSLLDGARRTYRKLTLLEDVLVIYRLEIGGRHRIFYLDVGNVSHTEALALTRKYQRQFGKKQYFSPQTGEWTSRFNPLNLTADIFWPVRKGSESRIDYLGVDPNVNGITDIEYFRDKLFAALKIPKAYIGLDAYSSVKYGLSQVDISFGRFVRRPQRAILVGLTRLAQLHLAFRGIDPKKPENAFQLHMLPPSTLDEQQRMEAMDMSLDLGMKLKQAGELFNVDPEILDSFIRKNILGVGAYGIENISNEPAGLDAAPPADLSDAYDNGLETFIEEIDDRLFPDNGGGVDLASLRQDKNVSAETSKTDPTPMEISESDLDYLRGCLTEGSSDEETE